LEQLIGLNLENAGSNQEKEQHIAEFLDGHRLEFPCALATSPILSQIPDFRSIPTTIYIDHTGKARLKTVRAHEYMEAVLTSLIGEKPAPPAP
jgi:predicted TIM-barrel fold metal-dependent hydrolase